MYYDRKDLEGCALAFFLGGFLLGTAVAILVIPKGGTLGMTISASLVGFLASAICLYWGVTILRNK